MVKMVPLGEHLLLQWMAPKSFREPRMLELNVSDYVDKAASSEAGELLGTDTAPAQCCVLTWQAQSCSEAAISKCVLT